MDDMPKIINMFDGKDELQICVSGIYLVSKDKECDMICHFSSYTDCVFLHCELVKIVESNTLHDIYMLTNILRFNSVDDCKKFILIIEEWFDRFSEHYENIKRYFNKNIQYEEYKHNMAREKNLKIPIKIGEV